MMTGHSVTILVVIFTICLSLIFHQCHGFKVIQPPFQKINPDGSASIICEHTINTSSVTDVRLNSIPLDDRTKRSVLCQKGMKHCKNIVMYSDNPNQWLFILLHIGSKAMDVEYECEFTLTKMDLDETKRGTPTRLQQGQQTTVWNCVTPAPDPHQLNQLSWILIGLIAVIFVYGWAITCLYISLRINKNNNNKKEIENSTYVEMRKAPLLTNNGF